MALIDNIVAYWKLDEASGNAADSTANGATLTNVNTATFSAGKINNGVSLARTSSQQLKVSDTVPLSVTGAMTLSSWVKVASQPANNTLYGIMNKYMSTDRGFSHSYYNNAGTKQLVFTVAPTATTEVSAIINQTLNNGTWYHIVCVYIPSTSLEIFVNGTSIGSNTTSIPASQFDNAQPFAIGTTVLDAEYMNGMVDEVGIWSRALSGAEVTSLYNAGVGLQYPFTAAGPANVKTINGLALASCKTWNGLAIASVKTVCGLA